MLLGAKDGPDGHLLVLADAIVVGGFHKNSYFLLVTPGGPYGVLSW